MTLHTSRNPFRALAVVAGLGLLVGAGTYASHEIWPAAAPCLTVLHADGSQYITGVELHRCPQG